jgi:hypothetical protein
VLRRPAEPAGPSLPNRYVRYHVSFRHKQTSITPKLSARFVVYGLIFPKSFEPVGRKRSVARSVLDIAVAEIGLQRARIFGRYGNTVAGSGTRRSDCAVFLPTMTKHSR